MSMKEGMDSPAKSDIAKEQQRALTEGTIPQQEPLLDDLPSIGSSDLVDIPLPDDGRRPYSGDQITEIIQDDVPDTLIFENLRDSDINTIEEGKDSFDPKVEQDLSDAGFDVHTEDEYKGRSKPDYIAKRGGEDTVHIGETKSPAECSSGKGGWFTDQSYDSERMKKAREDAREAVANGVPRDVAGHQIIINGQIPDYADKVKGGKVTNLPEGVTADATMKGAYSVPASEASNVEKAFDNLDKSYEKIEGDNGTVTYVYDLD